MPQKGADIDEKKVLSALDGRLAKFKLPKKVIFVEELPRNTMGKVQKAALRRPMRGYTSRVQPFSAFSLIAVSVVTGDMASLAIFT